MIDTFKHITPHNSMAQTLAASQATKYRHAAVIRSVQQQTPYLLIDLEQARKQCTEFKKHLPDVKLYYAVKALSDDKLIKGLIKYVDGFDVASIGEIKNLTDLGADPLTLAYSNPVKSIDSIKQAYAMGVRMFAYQSQNEIEKLAEHAPGATVFLRVMMDDSDSEVPLSYKFGCRQEDVIDLLKAARTKGLSPIGLTFHVGSQATGLQAWSRAIAKSRELIEEARNADVSVEYMNLGGGFPAQYFVNDTPFAEVAAEINRALGDSVSDFQLMAEPGRMIVAEACSVVATIIGIEERDGAPWMYMDVGVFQAFSGAMRYDVFPYSPYSLRHAQQEQLDGVTFRQTVIAGPTCDSQDVLTENAWLPDDLRVGDTLIFPNTGAYTVSYESAFNGFPLLDRHYVDEAAV